MESTSSSRRRNWKKRSSRGRQKIEIRKIEKEAALQVAFTKRRQGVMKKASELSILCGVDFAIVAFSPAGKPFSFGHPSVDSVVARFLDHGRPAAEAAEAADAAALQAAECQLSLHCIEMEQLVEAARGRRAAAEERLKAAAEGLGEAMGRALEMEEMEGMSVEELEAARSVMQDLRRRVELRQQEFLFAAAVAGGPQKMSAAVAAVAAPRPISMVLSSVGGDEDRHLEMSNDHHHHHPFTSISGSFFF